MGILAWIIVGLIAGILAKWILPGKDPGGIIVTIIIGIVGALLGGFIARAMGMGDVTGINISTILIAIVGSIVLLLIYRLAVGRRTV